jgi:nucleoid DNA-binding protein
LAAFTGRALTIFRAGLALKVVGSLVNGLIPSKSELIQKVMEQHPTEIARKDVKGVIEAVTEIGHKELKKTGAFVVPGFAKLIVVQKPATKARLVFAIHPSSCRIILR